MANALPAKLKSADIQRFALRASQLETAKPAIAYWCEYWIVNQLLARELHSADAECLQYTTNLMDKLEQTKLAHADNPEVIDDAAGQAAVLEFGMQTFERADKAVQADRVTKQTADTFLAAATFLELLNIWGEPSQEAHAKIRYAKWNAVRIVKAIKEGKDPNESNPKPEPEPEVDLQPLDPNDPEVQALGGVPDSMQPSVEEVPDEQGDEHVSVHRAAKDESSHPFTERSPGPSPLPKGELPTAMDTDVSPLESSPNTRDGSVGGGYFPEVPTETRSPILPSAPEETSSPPTPDITEANQLPTPGIDPNTNAQDFYRQTFTPSQETPNAIQAPPQKPTYISAPAPATLLPPFTTPISQTIPKVTPSNPPRAPVQPSARSTARAEPVYITDDKAVALAQKHARFAISALNFDDAATAVKELREALRTLGADP